MSALLKSSTMISLTEARRLIAAAVAPRLPRTVRLDQAHGLVLAEDITTDTPCPDADRSQMDGYVIRADAPPGTFRLTGEIPAGTLPTQPLLPGTCQRIYTGAILPPHGGRVIMQEDALTDGDQITLTTFHDRLYIRKKGCEALPGDIILPAGTRLGAVELSILAQLGITHPHIIPAPTVRHLATGGELVDPATQPHPGQIRDTNSTLLRALFATLGVTAFHTSREPDDPAALAKAADTPDDFLILSGGASVGDYDFSTRVLRQLGYTIHFDKVNLRPGKPLTFATRGTQAAFVLPGNPVSHFVCFHTAVRLAIECATGRPLAWPAIWLPLTDNTLLTPDPRETWWPAHVRVIEGQLTVTPKPWSSSANSFSLAGTNALILVNPTSPAQGRALTLLLEPPSA